MAAHVLRVPVASFESQWREIEEDAIDAFRRVGASGRYILGPEVEAFEQELARRWELPHAVGVGNGLDAIEIGLRAAGLRPGDRVLTTPVSAFATTLAIVRAGGRPCFVDVDESGLLDLEPTAEALAREPDIRFLVPVHLYGIPIDLEKLAALSEQHGVTIVEDCAQAIGSTWAGRRAGSVGRVAATSFYPTKNLGALGDGGALLTAEDAVANRARSLRHSGRSSTGRHDVLGMNSRLDELQAALLRSVLLPRWPSWHERRIAIAARYLAAIRCPGVRLPVVDGRARPAWHQFPVRVDAVRRSAFREELLRRGIETSIHYRVAIPDQKAFDGLHENGSTGGLERARAFVAEEVSLPMHPFLSDDDVAAVVDAVNRWSG